MKGTAKFLVLASTIFLLNVAPAFALTADDCTSYTMSGAGTEYYNGEYTPNASPSTYQGKTLYYNGTEYMYYYGGKWYAQYDYANNASGNYVNNAGTRLGTWVVAGGSAPAPTIVGNGCYVPPAPPTTPPAPNFFSNSNFNTQIASLPTAMGSMIATTIGSIWPLIVAIMGTLIGLYVAEKLLKLIEQPDKEDKKYYGKGSYYDKTKSTSENVSIDKAMHPERYKRQ